MLIFRRKKIYFISTMCPDTSLKGESASKFWNAENHLKLRTQSL